MKRYRYLRSKLRRGRWFHTYRRGAKEIAVGVHGLHPSDPRVFAAYCAEHSRWEQSPPDTVTPKGGTFAWAMDIYAAVHILIVAVSGALVPILTGSVFTLHFANRKLQRLAAE